MTFAPWSLVYILPALVYGCYSIAVRRTIIDPLLVGGCFLSLMFLVHEPYEQAFNTYELLLIHVVSSASYWCGGLIAYRMAQVRQRRSRLVLRERAWIATAICTLAVSGFVFVVIYQSSWDLMLAMRNRPDLQLGSVEATVGLMERLAQYLTGYLAPGAAFTVLLWCRRGKVRTLPVILLVLAIAAPASLMVAGGSRGAVCFLGLFCAFAVHFGLREKAHLRVAAKFAGFALVPVLLVTVLTQTLFRHVGLPVAGFWQAQERVAEASSAILDHASFNDEVQFVLSSYPRYYEFTRGYSLLTPWVVFVPRSMWPSKPVPWGRDLAWKYGYRHDTVVSVAATVQGEGYVNFGWLGWASFPFAFGALIGWTFRRLQSPRDDLDLVFGLWSVFWALSLRGDVHSALAAIVFPSFVFVLGLRLFAFRSSNIQQSHATLLSRIPRYLEEKAIRA